MGSMTRDDALKKEVIRYAEHFKGFGVRVSDFLENSLPDRHRKLGSQSGYFAVLPSSDPRWKWLAAHFGIIDRECAPADAQPDESALRSSSSQQDPVERPSHYTQYAIEPVTFIMRNGIEFWRGNIVKYAARAGHKLYEGMTATESEKTDLRKSIRYAQMRINQLDGKVEL